ncbi:MAG: phosphoglycerate kinase [Myxococcales bacterium]
MSRPFKTIDDIEVEGKRVFVRVDFNVPLDGDRTITDDSRIQASLPTLRQLRDRGARLVLASHLGRPKGKRKPELSLEPAGARLAELMDQEVLFPDDCIGDGPKKLVQNLRDGQILLLENLRFHPEEEAGDDTFARHLASFADLYVNDAFGTAHRAHASVTGVPKHLPDKAAGLLMARELDYLSRLLKGPEAPFVLVLGGAKVSDKIGVLENMLSRVQAIVVGGAMSYTFLAARGVALGASRVEVDKVQLAERILHKAEARGIPLVLPVDHLVVKVVDAASPARVVKNGELEPDDIAVDIGPATAAAFCDHIGAARTIFWNGPMGIFEMDAFAKGTETVAHAIAKGNALSVVGGGDSVAAVRKTGVTPFISHISTGGGASLELLEGQDLPGVAALRIGRHGQEG